jgi:hypothetical protein
LAPLGIPKLSEGNGEACFTHVNVVDRTPPTQNLHLCFYARSRDELDAFHRAGGNNIEPLYRDVANPGYAG